MSWTPCGHQKATVIIVIKKSFSQTIFANGIGLLIVVYLPMVKAMHTTKRPISLAKLLAPYRGKWVTLTKDQKKVLGSGETIDEALNAAEKKGELLPFLIKVPDASTAILLY